jgi:glutamate racemase
LSNLAAVNNHQPIRFGLFDSGVGGLSVLRRLHQLASACPARTFEFVYLGDTARCPYGNRDPVEIRQFLLQMIGFLSQQGVNHLVMACNTSAAVGLEQARQASPVPVHDLITPTARYVASRYRRIGVMATRSTVSSQAFSRKILYHAPDRQVFEIACPTLVPLVEAGELFTENVKASLIEYTSQLEEHDVEAVILGCTHFPFLRRAIADLLSDRVAIIDPAEMLVRQLIHDFDLGLTAENISEPVAELYCTHAATVYTTGSPYSFSQAASTCLGKGEASIIPFSNIKMLPLEVLQDSHPPGVYAPEAQAAPASISNVVQMPQVQSTLESKLAP